MNFISGNVYTQMTLSTSQQADIDTSTCNAQGKRDYNSFFEKLNDAGLKDSPDQQAMITFVNNWVANSTRKKS